MAQQRNRSTQSGQFCVRTEPRVHELIRTDGRHARIFTLSGWKRRPRNVVLLFRRGRTTALAVGALATTMITPLLVPNIAISISAVPIPVPTVAIYLLVTITIPIAVTTILFAVTVTVLVPLPLAITVAAAATTRAAGAVSARWR
jgi:hypothetical protein